MTVVHCPRCGRNNGTHRRACMFCGESLPLEGPVSAAPSGADLDAVVKRAFRTGNTQAVLLELSKAATAEATGAMAVEAAGVEAAVEAVTDTLEAALDAIVGVAFDARKAWVSGDPGQASAHLDRLRKQVERVQPRLGEAPVAVTPPEVTLRLPNIHQPFALVVDGPGDADLAVTLAAALRVDGVTARQLALSRFPKVVLRGDDRAILQAQADEVSTRAGLGATVIGKEDIVRIPGPRTLLERKTSVEGPELLRVTTAPLWLDENATGRENDVPQMTIRLAIPGQVTVRRSRPSQATSRLLRKKGPDVRDLGETRIGVVDLYGEKQALRVVEGITRFDGFGVADAQSASRSFRSFVAALETLFPGIKTLGYRICRWEDTPTVTPGEGAQTDGWAAWEEHTRLCLLHVAPQLAP